MAIGRNSHVVKIKVFNKKETKEFLVQVNKNGGICDIQPRPADLFNFYQGQPLDLVFRNLKSNLIYLVKNEQI